MIVSGLHDRKTERKTKIFNLLSIEQICDLCSDKPYPKYHHHHLHKTTKTTTWAAYLTFFGMPYFCLNFSMQRFCFL